MIEAMVFFLIICGASSVKLGLYVSGHYENGRKRFMTDNAGKLDFASSLYPFWGFVNGVNR